MRVSLLETPVKIRRRVANALESMRGTSMASNGNNAHLGEFACPIYRPDIKGIAYWEFEIVGLEPMQSQARDDRGSAVGFMLASTARHDFPIPHWSFSIQPPSHAIESKVAQSKVARICKLDTLAYVAENEDEKYLAHLGQFPLQILEADIEDSKFRGISSLTAMTALPSADDGTPVELRVKREGMKVPKIELATWQSWPAVKRSFGKTYRPYLNALEKRAAEAWKIEESIDLFGEGILEGRIFTVPLLGLGRARVTGDGAKFVKLTILDRQQPAVLLEALPSKVKKEISFQLLISYRDGTSETLMFFVVPNGTPTDNRS